MEWTKEKVNEELKIGWTGPNESCAYHPCHYQGQDCTYCFCPFYPCQDPQLGQFVTSSRTGQHVWSCVDCHLMHREGPCRYVAERVSSMEIRDVDDIRLAVLFPEVKARFLKPGKALMVLGSTSGAGKSLTVTALCRIIANMKRSVSPFKSQNMSLNSYVTKDGYEISRIQHLQSLAARIDPDYRVNPILLKPKGDSVSQVIVEGKPFGDFDVQSYYRDFVPGPGTEALQRNLDFLRLKYDHVVMEGAGSPAEINIYDQDIANMRAAAMADAECVLVVNMEWGGAFAYAYGTLALLKPEDRRRVKGLILNNMHGDVESLASGVEMIEDLTGVPVVGVVPHVEISLPTEDSMFFRDGGDIGKGKVTVGVVRLPRISNFTDLDALALEDVSIKFVETPSDLDGVQAIIIPGTKNTVQDLKWLRQVGLDEAIRARKGKMPILGICGGYQILGQSILDQHGLEGGEGGEMDGLGLLSSVTVFRSYGKRTQQVVGTMLPEGEPIRGYEIHMGETDRRGHHPLFLLRDADGEHEEGCWDESMMVFGTYLHGLFDLPSFRRKFLSYAAGESISSSGKDIADVVEENLDLLAEHFKCHLDADFLNRILGEGRQ